MQREKLLIYPFDYEMLPALDRILYEDKFVVTGIVSFGGWGYVGKDAGNIIYGSTKGMTISDDFYLELSKCDTVLFCKSDNEIIDFKSVLEKMKYSLKSGKNVICFYKLDSEIECELDEIAHSQNVYFRICLSEYEATINLDLMKSIELSDFDASIIFVMGISENTNKYGVELALHKNFQNSGYKSILIGSKAYGSFFGDYDVPDFMLDNSVMDYEKPLLFNKYVKNIEKKEKPDVIIIGVPGGIMPINKKNNNKFGMLAYQISCALPADVTVLCNHFNYFDDNYFNYVHPLMKYRFGKEIDCMYVNNSVIDLINEDVQGEVSYIHVYPEKVLQEVKRIEKDNVFADMQKLYDYVLNLLEQYGTNVII